MNPESDFRSNGDEPECGAPFQPPAGMEPHREVFVPPGSSLPGAPAEPPVSAPRKVALPFALVGGILIAFASLLVAVVVLAWTLGHRAEDSGRPDSLESVVVTPPAEKDTPKPSSPTGSNETPSKENPKPVELTRKLVAGVSRSSGEMAAVGKARQDLAEPGAIEIQTSLKDGMETKLKNVPEAGAVEHQTPSAPRPGSEKYFVAVGKGGVVGLSPDRFPGVGERGCLHSVVFLPKGLSERPAVQSGPFSVRRQGDKLMGGATGSLTVAAVAPGGKGIDVSQSGLSAGSAILLRVASGKETLLIPGEWEFSTDLTTLCDAKQKSLFSWVEPVPDGMEIQVKVDSTIPHIRLSPRRFPLAALDAEVQAMKPRFQAMKQSIEKRRTEDTASADGNRSMSYDQVLGECQSMIAALEKPQERSSTELLAKWLKVKVVFAIPSQGQSVPVSPPIAPSNSLPPAVPVSPPTAPAPPIAPAVSEKYFVAVGKGGAIPLPSNRIPEREKPGCSYSVITLPRDAAETPVAKSGPFPLMRYGNNLVGGAGGNQTVVTVIPGEKGIDLSPLGLPSGSGILLQVAPDKKSLLVPGDWALASKLAAIFGAEGKLLVPWVEQPSEAMEIQVALDFLRKDLPLASPPKRIPLAALDAELNGLRIRVSSRIQDLHKTEEAATAPVRSFDEHFRSGNLLAGVVRIQWVPIQLPLTPPRFGSSTLSRWGWKLEGNPKIAFRIDGADASFQEFAKSPEQSGRQPSDQYIAYLSSVCNLLKTSQTTAMPTTPSERTSITAPSPQVLDERYSFQFSTAVGNRLDILTRYRAMPQSRMELNRLKQSLKNLCDALAEVSRDEAEPHKANRDTLSDNLAKLLKNIDGLWVQHQAETGQFKVRTEAELNRWRQAQAEYQNLLAALEKPGEKSSAEVLAKWFRAQIVLAPKQSFQ